MSTIIIEPGHIVRTAAADQTLMSVLHDAGIYLDAPCGGAGKCGKCKVIADGAEVLACQSMADHDMTVNVAEGAGLNILQKGIEAKYDLNPSKEGYLAAVDIGTTSVVCFLLDPKDGKELAVTSMLNPQTSFGGDVISRIQAANEGSLDQEAALIREGVSSLIKEACGKAGISASEIGLVSIVGNPAMQQLFLAIPPANLAAVPFDPVILKSDTVACSEYLALCDNADLLIVPDIAGYIGADTMGCVLSTEMYLDDPLTLMVDIGTNGEMVLGNKDRMIACSTAAGPALEGANIKFGMRGTEGAIDHVRMEDGELKCTVIGGIPAKGICGSGLIDAVAAALDNGLINKRGRIQAKEEIDGQRVIPLCDGVYLTQDDIRQVQLAKGAIFAGIRLMSQQLGVAVADIDRVLLAGAFGNYLDPKSACRIELLPMELEGKILPVGNAAGSGAKMLVLDQSMLPLTDKLIGKIEFLELASLPEFPNTFAKSTAFTA